MLTPYANSATKQIIVSLSGSKGFCETLIESKEYRNKEKADAHRGAMTKPAKYCFNANELRMIKKPFACITVPSWQEYGGYALDKMMNPAATADDGAMMAELSGDMYNKRIKLIW